MEMVDAEREFSRAADAFHQAHRAHRDVTSTRSCSFGGSNARIRIVGEGCAARLLPPFSHLFVDRDLDRSVELSIDVWDATESGVPYPGSLPPLHLTTSEFGFVSGSESDRFVGCFRPNLFTWIDRNSERFVACTPTAGGLGVYELAKPLLYPLISWHARHDCEVLHAALVDKDGEGILFAGREGAGKTTAALACLQAGFNYLGDDYIGLREKEGTFLGYSIYNSAWLEEHQASVFPSLKNELMRAEMKKLPVVLSGVYPDRLRGFAAIRLLVLPKVTESRRCRVDRASKRDALLALAPTSIVKRPGATQKIMDKMALLIDRVPTYTLAFGPDLDRVAMQMEALLDLHHSL